MQEITLHSGEKKEVAARAWTPRARTFDFRWKENLQPRLRAEWVLLRLYMWKMLLCFFLVGYFCSIVFRNLAFLQHRQMAYYMKDGAAGVKHARLLDLGFELTPDWSHSKFALLMNEMNLTLILSSLLVTTAVVTLCPWLKTRPNVLNVAMRFFFSVSTVHMCRPLFYLSTSLPGPGQHCMGEEEIENHPWTVKEIFFGVNPATNCGDLIFSGHIAMAVTVLLTQHRYWGEMSGPGAQKVVLGVGTLLIMAQAFIAICTRSHYTVDIVTGTFMAVFIWTLHQTWLRPKDPSPDDPETQRRAIASTGCFDNRAVRLRAESSGEFLDSSGMATPVAGGNRGQAI